MSDFDTVLERLVTDPGFARALAADPDAALAGYRLDADEVALLRSQVSADGSVDVYQDRNADGRIDFVGHDANGDGVLEGADYDENFDGHLETHMVDTNGDGWMDKRQVTGQ